MRICGHNNRQETVSDIGFALPLGPSKIQAMLENTYLNANLTGLRQTIQSRNSSGW